jgi:hypothetical protein
VLLLFVAVALATKKAAALYPIKGQKYCDKQPGIIPEHAQDYSQTVKDNPADSRNCENYGQNQGDIEEPFHVSSSFLKITAHCSPSRRRPAQSRCAVLSCWRALSASNGAETPPRRMEEMVFANKTGYTIQQTNPFGPSVIVHAKRQKNLF